MLPFSADIDSSNMLENQFKPFMVSLATGDYEPERTFLEPNVHLYQFSMNSILLSRPFFNLLGGTLLDLKLADVVGHT